ncbi:MAG: long-chain-fatty-acid--CoA ligase [Pseudomonadota bacterium]
MAVRDIIQADTVDQLIRDLARLAPDRTALIFEGETASYGELNQRANRAAHALKGLGVCSGDRVVWLARNLGIFWDALLGAAKIGAVLTPVNWRLAPPEIAQIIKDSGAKILIGERIFLDPLLAEAHFELPKAYDLETGGEKDFALLAGAALDDEPEHSAEIDDIVVQLYTSGTTGLPKGVLLTHRNYRDSGAAGAELGILLPQTDDETALHALPHFHVAGVNFGLMAMARMMPILQMRQFDPAEIVDAAQGTAPLNSFFVPAMIMMILQTAKEKQRSLEKFAAVSYGAAPMPAALLDAAMTAMPNAQWTQFYGATETTGALTTLSHADHAGGMKQRASAGKPLPGCEIRVVNPETGQDALAGEVGEILTRSGFVMQGYWKRPEATAACLKDNWYHTGDAGYTDEKGYLYVVDRIKDMIISGGENIYPAELENILGAHPAIAEVAVVGAPDEKWGEIVKVIAVRRPGEALEEDDIFECLHGKIAAFKMPRIVEFIEALPRNPSGKVLKTKLRTG